jgi:catechol 2,3-dioxygenase-like lactoylglutathione lyase family enzyme
MEVRNIRWVGVPVRNYEAMVALLREVLGLRVNFQESTTVEFSTVEGDEIQIMAPGDAYYDFFTENAAVPFRCSRSVMSIAPAGSLRRRGSR